MKPKHTHIIFSRTYGNVRMWNCWLMHVSDVTTDQKCCKTLIDDCGEKLRFTVAGASYFSFTPLVSTDDCETSQKRSNFVAPLCYGWVCL